MTSLSPSAPTYLSGLHLLLQRHPPLGSLWASGEQGLCPPVPYGPGIQGHAQYIEGLNKCLPSGQKESVCDEKCPPTNPGEGVVSAWLTWASYSLLYQYSCLIVISACLSTFLEAPKGRSFFPWNLQYPPCRRHSGNNPQGTIWSASVLHQARGQLTLACGPNPARGQFLYSELNGLEE